MTWFRKTVFLLVLVGASVQAAELRVVCTVPELADLVQQIGGDRVMTSSLARPSDNPHYVSARPSYIRQVSRANAFVLVGLDLEVGWAPAVLHSARNRKLQEGRPGYIDVSKAIQALEVPKTEYDRSYGDVHPHGNPHYLVSPLHGMQVARYLSRRLAVLDPAGADQYRSGADQLIGQLATALYGAEVVQEHGAEQLKQWHLAGSLWKEVPELGGWLQTLAALRGAAFINDHRQWPYLGQTFGFRIAEYLEPKAGIPPSNSHLKKVIQLVADKPVAGIITSPWFDQKPVRRVAEATGLKVQILAHQVRALPEAEDYLSFCATNVAKLASFISTTELVPADQ